MRNVTMQTFNRKCDRGEWEVDYEPKPGRNGGGFAQVRDCETGKVMTVKVTVH